jgi:hypothetical protein
MLDFARPTFYRKESIRAVEIRIDEQLAAIEKAVRDGASPRRNLLILGALITLLVELEDEE